MVTLSGPEPTPGSRQEKNENHTSALLQLGLLLLSNQYWTRRGPAFEKAEKSV